MGGDGHVGVLFERRHPGRGHYAEQVDVEGSESSQCRKNDVSWSVTNSSSRKLG